MSNQKAKQNVVLVMSDSHTPFAMGHYGGRVSTPNLDRFAAKSARFNNCYCNSPVCGPSRFSFLTGKHVHRCGAYDNASTMAVDQPTLGHLMTAAGYRTVFVGRMHLHGADQMIGFEERPVHDWINPIDSPPDHYQEDGELKELTPSSPADGYKADHNIIKTYDDHVATVAAEVMRSHGETDQRPLFLMVGFTIPHPAVAGREEYRAAYERYMAMNLPLPAFDGNDIKELSPYMRRLMQVSGKMPWLITKQLTAEYFARVEYFDQLWGQLDQALEQSGLAANSVVIYTSDHGENMGYHGAWGKMNFHERAVRVPMFAHVPGRGSVDISETVSLVDIFPTLAEISGQSVGYPLDGKSLLPLLSGGQKPGSGEAFSEYHGYCSPCGAYMLVRDGFKYCHYNSLPPELYDLRGDPDEKENLAGRPEFQNTLCRMKERLLEIAPDPLGIERMIRENQAQRSLMDVAVRRSEPMQRQLLERIRVYREQRDEPWWDGGKTIDHYQTQFTKAR